MKPAAAIVLAAAIATPAMAWTPGPQATNAAAAGKVWVDVSADPAGPPALARGVVDIDAPPAVVWKLMVDCAATRRIMPSNRGCKVLKTDPGGRWDVREHIMKTPIMPNVRSVFREDLEVGRKIVITRIEGDMKVLNGEWRLEPLDGGKRTRVINEMRMQPGFAAPGMLVRSFVKGEVQTGLTNLRREAEAAAKKG